MVERSLVAVAFIVALQIPAAIASVVLLCPARPTSRAHILARTGKSSFESPSPLFSPNHHIGNSSIPLF
jgi:hypothetical protein